MTTSISIHNATNITTSGVSHDNANAITLTVGTKGHYGDLPHFIKIFGLPTHIADALEELLGKGGIMTDAEQDAQRLQWANDDEAARKAATDAHFPDFDEHAEAMFDDRRTSPVFSDGVLRIPAVAKG